MKFTTPCYMKITSLEQRQRIIKKLEEFSYKISETVWSQREYIITQWIQEDEVYGLIPSQLKYVISKKVYIDCGENENLFLALTALKHHTDRHHFYKNTNGKVIKCDYDNIITEIDWNDDFINRVALKLTTEEIVNHFKNKENVSQP